MKNTILLLLLLLTSKIVFSQTANIQVNGEAGLSVFLNNQFKGKTSTEYNGLIIENVTAGKNLIKIIKEGYTPFEEYITVKPGEVFAYKIQPFTKHLVEISEKGNSGETDKKAIIKTGKLIIQSVPIEIKITMPDIEGIANSQKSKDEWMVDKIETGNYEISFSYGQKLIKKTVRIESDKITSVFVNMLNGDFVAKIKLEEKHRQRFDSLVVIRTIDSLFRVYKFKRGLYENEFRNYNEEAANLIPLGGGSGLEGKLARKDKTPGPYQYYKNSRTKPVFFFEYILQGEPYQDAKMLAFYTEQLNYFKRIIPEKYLKIESGNFSFGYPFIYLEVSFRYNKSGSTKADKYSYVDFEINDHQSYPKQ